MNPLSTTPSTISLNGYGGFGAENPRGQSILGYVKATNPKLATPDLTRYKVIPGSESCHCCFGFSIIDTQTPHEAYKDRFDTVCECFDEADAVHICEALNNYKQPEKK